MARTTKHWLCRTIVQPMSLAPIWSLLNGLNSRSFEEGLVEQLQLRWAVVKAELKRLLGCQNSHRCQNWKRPRHGGSRISKSSMRGWTSGKQH